MDSPNRLQLPLQRHRDGLVRDCTDAVAVEAALELRIAHPGLGATPVAVATTMRTPGEDVDLALGHLYAEGIVDARDAVLGVRPCGGPSAALRVELAAHAPLPALRALQRHATVSSACGACGKADPEALVAQAVCGSVTGLGSVADGTLRELPSRLRSAQTGFAATGGVHAVGLFDLAGSLIALREDVGRHNALDKLVGHALQHDLLPWSDRVLLLSGRASFELLQKAARAGASIVAAIGAPSSLAVEVAQRAGITLVGFLSAQGFNVYAGAQRIAPG